MDALPREGGHAQLPARDPEGIPGGGGKLDLERVATYFGPASLHVEASADGTRIAAHVECDSDRRPQAVLVRLPHPLGLRPLGVSGGTYDAATETVRVGPFGGKADVELEFPPTR